MDLANGCKVYEVPVVVSRRSDYLAAGLGKIRTREPRG